MEFVFELCVNIQTKENIFSFASFINTKMFSDDHKKINKIKIKTM